ncbi:hypothetical protein QMM58_13355 [Clostridioides difficile]|nr:hypothetical protein [Clostridioides difficile]
MKNRVNPSVKESEELVDVPMIIDKDSISYYKKMGYKVQSCLLGNRKVPCVYVKGTQSFKDDYRRMLDAERKAEDRESRCLIADGHGGFIMCPEYNRCWDCEKRKSWNFDRYRPLSIEKLTEGDDEDDKTIDIPCKLDVEGEATVNAILDYILERLAAVDKDFSHIFEMRLDQAGVKEIADELNIPWSTAKDRIKKVEKLAQEFYSKKSK